jgi:hypothetical protein
VPPLQGRDFDFKRLDSNAFTRLSFGCLHPQRSFAKRVLSIPKSTPPSIVQHISATYTVLKPTWQIDSLSRPRVKDHHRGREAKAFKAEERSG